MAKTILAVSEKLIVLQMAEKCSLMKHSNTLLIRGSRLMGRKLLGSECSRAPLKTGTTEATFRDIGHTKADEHRFYNLATIDDSLGQHIFNTITGIPSGPVAFEASRIRIILSTFLGVINGISESV